MTDKYWNPIFEKIQSEITYKEGFKLLLRRDNKDLDGRWYYQVECKRPDSTTGEMGVGRGGKGYLSPHMNSSELARLAFGLFLSYEEHECREFFKLSNRAVFGPHIDIQTLWLVANHLDYRS